ncbi:MAG: DUF72 domain-containing protein, partial [Nitrospinota bacterium]|nr:DUF72 domain-containing protein [Nitrospinota bacterium]
SDQPSENNEERVIRVGASGFSYDDWIGPVYPQGTKRSDMLHYYAHELKFDLVELNYTYYTMPEPKGIEGMLSRVEPGFAFIAKAHQSMTHKIRDESGGYIRDETAVATFKEGLAPLIDGERLACVLAQFPMKFSRGTQGMDHIAWLAERLAPVRMVVEFRNKAWIAQSVFDFLKKIGVGYCVVDEPDLPSLSPFMPVATTDIAYFRFHGRNKKWFGVSAAQRHNYEYSESELRQFLTPINKVAEQAKTTLVLFNNHFGGQAARNAMAMRELLGLAGQKATG